MKKVGLNLLIEISFSLILILFVLFSSCKKEHSSMLTKEEWDNLELATIKFNATDCPGSIIERNDCDKKMEIYDKKANYREATISVNHYMVTYDVTGDNTAIIKADEEYSLNFHYVFKLTFTSHYRGKYECYFNGEYKSKGHFRIKDEKKFFNLF